MGYDLSPRQCHIRAQAKPRCIPLLRRRSKAALGVTGALLLRGEANT
jgi:hypothetical protein